MCAKTCDFRYRMLHCGAIMLIDKCAKSPTTVCEPSQQSSSRSETLLTRLFTVPDQCTRASRSPMHRTESAPQGDGTVTFRTLRSTER